MAYSELIKSFGSIREYLRSFYVYGFRYRGEFDLKSARSYDNERRRVESWLGDYMSFSQDAEGRRVFLSIDSRAIPENPFYQAFRAKTFTDRDIMLHFQLLDILADSEGLSISAIMEELTDRLSEFEAGELPDESTVRKKLKEYVSLGLLQSEKRGRETRYTVSQSETDLKSWDAAAAFFSEAAPLGVIGSYVLERKPKLSCFRFKHHYILNALDGEILAALFDAMGQNRLVTFLIRGQQITALPLKIYAGCQTGRQYLLAWSPRHQRFSFHRLDLMDGVKAGEVFDTPDFLPEKTENFCRRAWGAAGKNYGKPVRVEMTVSIGAGEEHILHRLEREKRCGAVERIDETRWRFSADVYDALEMLPWLRTFIGRITELKCTDPEVTKRFWEDFRALTALEKRWMKAVLADPRIQLFSPDETGLEDVEPLFTPDKIVYYDRYTDGDPYGDPSYIAHFRTILQALYLSAGGSSNRKEGTEGQKGVRKTNRTANSGPCPKDRDGKCTPRSPQAF